VNVEVAVDVAMMLPVINVPYAVVDARVADDVADIVGAVIVFIAVIAPRM
jgi:hypothetical protein